jgi:biotin carboxyl carrier protein
MKQYKFKINGNEYDVKIFNVDDNTATVAVNDTNYDVEIEGKKLPAPTKTPKIVQAPTVPSTDSHPSVAKTARPKTVAGDIKSPLPGVVLDVVVREGDTVKEGQHLLMLEAMKMENNIDSDKAGTVTRIHVRKGDSVLEGDVLITIG